MARYRKKKGSRSHKKKAIPIAVVAPLAAPAVQYVLPKVMAGDLKGAWNSLSLEYAGMDSAGKFHSNQLIEAYVPVGIGIVVHKMATKFGVNRYARKYSMGFLEI